MSGIRQPADLKIAGAASANAGSMRGTVARLISQFDIVQFIIVLSNRSFAG
jgi:hypothetical protein